MSLFGLQNSQSQPSGAFGSANTPQKGSIFGSQAPQTGSSFGQGTQQTAQSTPFGGIGQQQQQQQPQQQQQQQPAGNLFGGVGSSNQQPQQQSSNLFSGLGSSSQPQQQGGLGGLSSFGQPQQQSQGGIGFSGLGSTSQQQQNQQKNGAFSGLGASSQQQSGSAFPTLASNTQQSQLGQTVSRPQANGSTIWTPGQGMTGVHRTVPMQMMIVKDKWDPVNRASPFRTYTYNHAGEDAAPFFQPGPNEDEAKWEEALRKRPGATYVPVLVQGFWELGKRAQRQRDFLSMMQNRLHHLNGVLTDLLSRHDLNISVKLAACRRKHKVLSQRCLAVAAKSQVLRNRGYNMDEAEEALQTKLRQLERSVFDPSLNGRSEEIWARMLAIREHSKQLQQGLDRAGREAAEQNDDTLDDSAIKMAKKILDDYAVQIEHLNKELVTVQQDLQSLQTPPTS